MPLHIIGEDPANATKAVDVSLFNYALTDKKANFSLKYKDGDVDFIDSGHGHLDKPSYSQHGTGVVVTVREAAKSYKQTATAPTCVLLRCYGAQETPSRSIFRNNRQTSYARKFSRLVPDKNVIANTEVIFVKSNPSTKVLDGIRGAGEWRVFRSGVDITGN